jgi:hypothetical protein
MRPHDLIDQVNQVPRNSSNLLSSAGTDTSLILAGGKLPELTYRARRVTSAIEDRIVINTAKAFRIFDVSPILHARRYYTQVWLYGIASYNNGVPNANAQNIYWGYSAHTLNNTVFPYGGAYGGLIQPVDGEILDLSEVYVMGTVNDAITVTAFP